MVTGWKEAFAPHILARGEKYFQEERVRRIRRVGNTYIADVAGTERYEVEITVGETGVEEMQCSCPYAQVNHCKHMAAVLLALEDDKIAVEELPMAKQPPIVSHIPVEWPWLDAVDHLPEDVIRRELMQRAEQNEWLKERLAVLYLGGLPEHQLQNWKADLQEMAGEYTDRTGRIDTAFAWDFLSDLSYFLEKKLPVLLEVKAGMDAFHLVWIVMETALEWEVEEELWAYDELCYGLDELFRECEKALESLLPLLTSDQREQVLQWYREHRDDTWPGDVAYMDRVFLNLLKPVQVDVGKRVMHFFGATPHYYNGGEWVPFPMRGEWYYDPVEETAAYKEAAPAVEKIVKMILGSRYGKSGSSREIQRNRKRLLAEMFGIQWFSFDDLNIADMD